MMSLSLCKSCFHCTFAVFLFLLVSLSSSSPQSPRLLMHKGHVTRIGYNKTINILTRNGNALTKLGGSRAERSILPWVHVTASHLASESKFSTNIRTDRMLRR